MFHHFITHVHIFRGSNSTLCTFVRGEIHRRDAYIKEEKTFFYEKTLFDLVLVFSVFYGALCSMLYCSHRSCLCVEHAYILMLVRMIICFAM